MSSQEKQVKDQHGQDETVMIPGPGRIDGVGAESFRRRERAGGLSRRNEMNLSAWSDLNRIGTKRADRLAAGVNRSERGG
jgi:hypothetical protein